MASETTFPTIKQLKTLSIDNLLLYSSRIALRALPLTVGWEAFDYISNRNDKAHIVAAINLSAAGFTRCSKTFSNLSSEAADVAQAAHDAVNDGEKHIDENFVQDTFAATSALFAATFASVYDAEMKEYIIDPHYSAIQSASSTSSSIDSSIISKSNFVYESNNDFKLSSSDNKKWQPLWSEKQPSIIQQKIEEWSDALLSLGLSQYVDNYKLILKGHPDPKKLYQPLYEDWLKKEESSLTDLLSGKKERTKKPKGSEIKGKEPKNNYNLHGRVSINSESPNSKDFLGRQRLVDAISELLTHTNQTDPLTIGLLGDWGAGKTTVINLLKNTLEKETQNNVSANYKIQTFNAWAYEHTENIQAGVAQEAIIGLSKDKKGLLNKINLAWCLHGKLGKFKRNTYSIFVGIWLATIIYLFLNGRITTIWEIGFSLTLSLIFLYNAIKPLFSHTVTKEFMTFFRLPDYTSQVGQLPTFQLQVKELAKICLTDNNRLLFVVDDLDRCSPDGIIKVFEAIRLVMDIPKVTVIIAIDHRVALSALSHQYKNLEEQGKDRNRFDIARDYLGKIIQLPINLDTPDRSMVSKYVDSLFDGSLDQSQTDDKLINELEPIELANNLESYIEENIPDGPISLTENPILDKIRKKIEEDKVRKNEANIENMFNQTMRHSGLEKKQFEKLARLLCFHNPRQLKRLHSSYRLLRAYTKTEEETNLKYMSALFFLEFIRNQKSSSKIRPEEILLTYFNKNSKEQKPFYSYLIEQFESEESYLELKEIIKPFVLPR